MALTATRLEAQYDRRYEVGLFGGFQKYDKAFNLTNKVGGGVRFAYALTPMMSLEVEGLFQSPQDISTVHLEPLIGSASLIVYPLNASRLSAYVLGGFTLLDFGNTSPYHFTDHGFHGGAGAKLYMSSRVAIRCARHLHARYQEYFPGRLKERDSSGRHRGCRVLPIQRPAGRRCGSRPRVGQERRLPRHATGRDRRQARLLRRCR